MRDPHSCDRCSGLFYPSGPAGLRSDAIIIVLGSAEQAEVVEEAERRGRENRANQVQHRYGGERYGTPQEQLENDIHACGAEKAVARWSTWPWNGKGGKPRRDKDAGPYYVRWTRHTHLLTHPKASGRLGWLDEGGHYILVTGKFPAYILRGWAHVPEDTPDSLYCGPPTLPYPANRKPMEDLHDLGRLEELNWLMRTVSKAKRAAIEQPEIAAESGRRVSSAEGGAATLPPPDTFDSGY